MTDPGLIKGKYELYLEKRRRQNIMFLAVVLFLIVATGLVSLMFFREESQASVARYRVPVPESFLTTAQHRVEPSILQLATRETLLPVPALKEDTRLKARLNQLFQRYSPRFNAHLFYLNPATGRYVSIGGDEPVSAASVIKLPVLFSYYRQQHQKRLAATTPLVYMEHHRTGGAGGLQYQPAGQILSADEVAHRMIQLSDNTATNIMIDYLGGEHALNQRLDALGISQTRIRNWLPDLPGTNTISMREMVTLLYNIENADHLFSKSERESALDILKGTHNRRLIPARLPRGTVVAHKTGDIGSALANAGIVYMPDNSRFYLSIQVDRPYNDYTARDIIQEASRLIYDYQ